MARNQISFATMDVILDQADLFWDDPAESYDDGDGVRVRPAYRGRGYRPEGFGLVIANEERLYRILAAAGLAAADLDRSGSEEMLDAVDFARAVETDQMGRGSIIVYWPDWEITDLPEHLTKDA
jgi:hypothetical protein